MHEDGLKRDETYKEVAVALNRLIISTDQNTMATTSADTYLKQRNGRDIEKHAELLKATEAIPITLRKIATDQSKAIIKAVTIQDQHVEHQHVDHEIVKAKRPVNKP